MEAIEFSAVEKICLLFVGKLFRHGFLSLNEVSPKIDKEIKKLCFEQYDIILVCSDFVFKFTLEHNVCLQILVYVSSKNT